MCKSDTPRSAEEPMNVLTAEWRIADATDEEGRHRIVWEDDTPNAWVWEVCADMTSDVAKHIVELHNATLSTPTTPVPTEKDTQWWIDEARGILTALCRENTRVIERVTRRVLIIRDEEGRVCPGDELHTEFLKAVEARANLTPSARNA